MSPWLRLLDEPAAHLVVSGQCPDGVSAAPGFPAESDRIAAGMFLERCASGCDPRPFGHFLMCLEDGLAIGGIGFHGAPDERGQVEIGYAIVPSYQRCGHATTALGLLVERAVEMGVRALLAETESDNVASRLVLERQGFVRSSVHEETLFYRRELQS